MNCPVCKTEAPPAVGKPFHSLADVHGHYVFGVDDGPSSLEMSMKMIRSAWQQGVRAIVCTSHSWGYLEKYECHFAQLKLCLQKEKLDVRLYPGAEIACSEGAVPGLLERLKNGALHTMGNSDYVLLEFDPYVQSEEILSCVKQFHAAGYPVMIAHVERYFHLHKDEQSMDVLQSWETLLQINAYSLVEETNEEIRRFARRLLAEKRVAFVGSDAHRPNHRPPNVSSGMAYIHANCPPDYAEAICHGNAERLLLME